MYAGDFGEGFGEVARSARDGLKQRYGEFAEKYYGRLERELSVIRSNGLAGRYLDARNLVTAIRRSFPLFAWQCWCGSESIVAFCLGISEIDPVKYGLPFESFFNPAVSAAQSGFSMELPVGQFERVVNFLGEKVSSVETIPEIGVKIARVGYSGLESSGGDIALIGIGELEAIRLVGEQVLEAEPDFDISSIPDDDGKAFDLLECGERLDLHWLEGEGMYSVLKKVRPRSILELAAAIAIYHQDECFAIVGRIPGDNGEDAIVRLFPEIKPMLEETFGKIVYREQVMEIAGLCAGYSLDEADVFRRVLCKRKEELPLERKRFVDSVVARGKERGAAEKLFGFLGDAACACPRKAQLVSRAVIIYRTAYLKAHYPDEYMRAGAGNR